MESLGLEVMTLSDGRTAYVQQDAHTISEEKLVEGQVIELEKGSTAFIQQVTVQNEPISFEDGQSIAMEDGTMVFIHHTPKEGYDPNTLEPIQLEEESTAFICHPVPMPVGSTILTVQADVRLEDLAAEEKDDAFVLETISAVKDYASKVCEEEEETASTHHFQTSDLCNVLSQGFQEEEVQSNGKSPQDTNKSYRCGYRGCSSFFTTSHHLKVHEQVHIGDRPYRCEFSSCGKTFSTGYTLRSHVRIHTGEKPYKCPEDVCTKAFKTSGDLQKHIRTHTGERPFKCPFEGCGQSFTTSYTRKVHIRTHTGERPYLCPTPNCGRGFTSATNYKNHMRIHTGEKPYACTVTGCGRRFTEYSSLYKHHVVHTHCNPYTCSTCGKTHHQTSVLAMHKRTAHEELKATEESEQALSEQQMEAVTVRKKIHPLKRQCIGSVTVEQGEDGMPTPVALISQDGRRQEPSLSNPNQYSQTGTAVPVGHVLHPAVGLQSLKPPQAKRASELGRCYQLGNCSSSAGIYNT